MASRFVIPLLKAELKQIWQTFRPNHAELFVQNRRSMLRHYSAAIALTIVSAHAVASDAFRPSAKQQLELGTRAAADLRKQSKDHLLPDSDARVILVRKVGERLINTFREREKDKPWKFSFDVIDDKTVNAFALPGGPMFVYTGLLSKLKTEDELAGVLGHELTHVRREHWAYQYADSMKRSLGLTALLLIFRANNTVANLANVSNEVLFDLRYSRGHESEADNTGLDCMFAAGYNPNGMADVFRMLGEQAGKGAPPEFLSDHPSDKRRVQNIQDRIKTLPGPFPNPIPLDPAITQLARGEKPKEEKPKNEKTKDEKAKEDGRAKGDPASSASPGA